MDLPLERPGDLPQQSESRHRPGAASFGGGEGLFEDTLTLVDSSQWPSGSRLLFSRMGRLTVDADPARALVVAQWQSSAAAGQSSWAVPRLGSTVVHWRDPAIAPQEAVWAGLATWPVFAEAPRPLPPAVPEGPLSVAAFNVGNYFLTLGERGAQTLADQRRQTARLAVTLRAMPVDVWALAELERGGEALNFLSAAVNSLAPGFRYLSRSPGGCPDGDEIEGGILYRSDRIRAVGEAYWLDKTVWRRCPLIQRFAAGDTAWTLVVVHFTSRRCPRTGATAWQSSGADGRACGQSQRAGEAAALAAWVSEYRASYPGHSVLVAGDFNGVRREQAGELLREVGLIDSMSVESPLTDEPRYSYAFAGRVSLLDGVMATEPMASRLAVAGVWHSNVDEPSWHSRQSTPDDVLFPPGENVALQAPQPWRSSDHDPVWASFRQP